MGAYLCVGQARTSAAHQIPRRADREPVHWACGDQTVAIHRLFTSETIAAASDWLSPEVRITLGILISFRN